MGYWVDKLHGAVNISKVFEWGSFAMFAFSEDSSFETLEGNHHNCHIVQTLTV